MLDKAHLIMQETDTFEVKISVIPKKNTWLLQLIKIWFFLTACNL